MAIALAPKLHHWFLAAGALLLIAALVHQQGGVETIKQTWQGAGRPAGGESSQPGQSPAVVRPSFHDIAIKHGTDKVTSHNYWYIYDKYLPAIREKRVKFLEIGLGCDMGYGPGASYYTWLEYFPNVDLYYMEYNAECAEKWAHKTQGATIVTGDQGDPAVLEKFIADHGGDFDIIVDDGGHTMNQQIVSINHLWKAVKPGGIYVCEDLETSYMRNYGGDESPTEGWRGANTMMGYIYELLADKMRTGNTHATITAELRSIDCDRQICAFIKKQVGDV